MKKFIFILTIIFLHGVELYSQMNMDKFYGNYIETKRHDLANFDVVNGSSYKNDQFALANVYMKNCKVPIQLFLRYNNLFDEMEMKKANEEAYLIVDKKENIDSISLLGETFVYLQYKVENIDKNGYYIKLISGKNNLYMKEVKEYIPEKQPIGGYQEYVPATIIDKPLDFYIQEYNRDPEILPCTMKGFLRHLKLKGCDLYDVAKQEKFKYDTESIVKIVQLYFNQLTINNTALKQ